jgi:hypothetical protein
VANTRHDRSGSRSAFAGGDRVVGAVLAVVVTLVTVKLATTAPRPVASESPASPVVVRQVTTVPAAVLTRVSPGQEITPLQTVRTSGPPLTIGRKPGPGA